MGKPMRVFYSGLSQSFYACRAYKEIKPGIVQLTGMSFDISVDVQKFIDEARAYLQSQLAAAIQERDEARATNLGWLKENGPGGWIDELRKQVSALTEQLNEALAVAEWKLITPESLPKIGDMAWGPYTAYSGHAYCYLQAITAHHVVTPDTMRVRGLTHYRPINAPIAEPQKGAE